MTAASIAYITLNSNLILLIPSLSPEVRLLFPPLNSNLILLIQCSVVGGGYWNTSLNSNLILLIPAGWRCVWMAADFKFQSDSINTQIGCI